MRGPKNNSVIIVEPNFAGHRLNYVNIIARYVRQQGNFCFFASASDTFMSEEYKERSLEGINEVDTISLGKLPKGIGLLYHLWLLRGIHLILRSNRGAKLVVLEGDKSVLAFALSFLPVRDITILIMRAPKFIGSYWFDPKDSLKRAGMWLISQRGARVLVLSPATLVAESYEHLGFEAVPDPIEVEATDEGIEDYKRLIEWSEKNKWIGVFGHVSRRKNLDLVFSAAASMEILPSILVAGIVSAEERQRVDPCLKVFLERGGRVIFDNRLLTESELNSAISIVDVVSVAHSSEGPSGILGKALALGVPVAAAGAESLRRDIDKLEAGCWSPLIVVEMADSFTRCMKIARKEPRKLAGGAEFAKALVGDN